MAFQKADKLARGILASGLQQIGTLIISDQHAPLSVRAQQCQLSMDVKYALISALCVNCYFAV